MAPKNNVSDLDQEFPETLFLSLKIGVESRGPLLKSLPLSFKLNLDVNMIRDKGQIKN